MHLSRHPRRKFICFGCRVGLPSPLSAWSLGGEGGDEGGMKPQATLGNVGRDAWVGRTLAEGSLGDLLRVFISLLPAFKMQLVRSAIKPTRDSSRRSSFYFRSEICAESGRAASSRALRAHPERSASPSCAARCGTCEPRVPLSAAAPGGSSSRSSGQPPSCPPALLQPPNRAKRS